MPLALSRNGSGMLVLSRNMSVPPETPTLDGSVYGAARIDLSWSASSGAESYTLQRRPSGVGTWSDVVTVPGTSWKDARLTASTAYDYRVSASNSNGTSPVSATVTRTTSAAGTLSSPPIEFNAVPFSATVINLTWNIQFNNTYFVIQRSLDGSTGWQTIAVPSAPPYSDTGLTPDTDYYYRLYGGRVGGEVLHIDPNDGALGPQHTHALGAPTLSSAHGLAVAPLSPTTIHVRWLKVQTPEGVPSSSYILERSPNGSSWTQVANQSASSFLDTGLTANTQYHYRFKAVGAGGTSSPSSSVMMTTLPNRTGRALLQPQDFTYLGSFQPPFYVDPAGDPPIGLDVRSSFSEGGMAIRRVGGQLRFFGLTSTAGNQEATAGFLYEFAPPASLATSTPFPEGTRIKYWGDPYHGKKMGFHSTSTNAFGSYELESVGGIGYTTSGLFADPTVPNRMWLTYGNTYNVAGTNSPAMLYIDINDSDGTIEASGPYRFNDDLPGTPNVQKVKAGAGAIPQWFADAHLNVGGNGISGDVWRMAGFGGNEAGAGVASMGPSLVAFNTARLVGKECEEGMIPQIGDIGTVRNVSDPSPETPLIESKTLIAHPWEWQWGTKPPGLIVRGPGVGWRSDTVNTGYFFTLDRVKGGCIWIDDEAGSRSKHGVLMAGCFGHGYSVYKAGNVLTGAAVGGPTCDGGQAFGFAVVDPDDLAEVAAGTRDFDEVPMNPPCWWRPDFYQADMTTGIIPYTGDFGVGTDIAPNGMAFDPVTNRLYVVVGIGSVAAGHSEKTPIIHVYQVAN